jgi:hypothetical protein
MITDWRTWRDLLTVLAMLAVTIYAIAVTGR